MSTAAHELQSHGGPVATTTPVSKTQKRHFKLGLANNLTDLNFMSRTRMSKIDILLPVLVFMTTLVLCSVLIAIPGYFGSDELLFLPRLSSMHATARFAVADMTTIFHPVTIFHSLTHAEFFRPLGMAILMLIMREDGSPFMPHFVMVAMHGINCVLLYCVLRDKSRRFATLAALFFAVSPLAMYSVGWIAAIYDLLVTMFGLLLVIGIRSFMETGRKLYLGSIVAFTILALLSKETAMAIPAIALLGLLSTDYRTETRRAFLAAGLVTFTCVLFFALRSNALLHAAEGSSGGYKVSFGINILDNLSAYLAYPFGTGITEVDNTIFMSRAGLLCSIAALLLTFGLAALSTGWRRGLAMATLFIIPLLPVLILAKHETQYLYASSIAVAMAVASCLFYGNVLIKLLGMALGGLLLVHAGTVQNYMYQTGQCQTRLINEVASHARFDAALSLNSPPIILPDHDAPWWVLARVASRWNLWNDSTPPVMTKSAYKANLIMTSTCQLIPNTPVAKETPQAQAHDVINH